MGNPHTPPIAPKLPIPPPVLELPWGTLTAGGQVYLNQHSYEFLQLLWSALQGGGGIVDLTISSMSADAGRIAALRQDLETALTAAMALPVRARGAGGGAATAERVGFGFEAKGAMADNEFLGFASWPVDVQFTGGDPKSYLTAFSVTPAAADAVFRIMSPTFVLLGTITVAAGDRFGTTAWVTDPYTHSANDDLIVFAPTPNDATLANVNALVSGRAV